MLRTGLMLRTGSWIFTPGRQVGRLYETFVDIYTTL